MAIQTITSAPAPKYSLANATIVSAGGKRVIAQSRDRTAFFATAVGTTNRNALHRSTDGGATWTLVKNFVGFGVETSSSVINSMVELPNGEWLIALGFNGGFPSRIYKTSGFAANPATATYTLKYTLPRTGILSQYTLNDRCIGSNGIVLAGEAGAQTPGTPTGITYTNRGTGYTTATLTPVSGGTGHDIRVFCFNGQIQNIGIFNGGTGHADGSYNFTVGGDGTGAVIGYTVTGGVINGLRTGATTLHMSTDFGDTWTQIFDLFTDVPSWKYGIGIHLHGACYDEQWDRIWVLYGDNTGNGDEIAGWPTNSQIVYSDDRGATWVKFPPIRAQDDEGVISQMTTIRVTKTAVMLGFDAIRTTGVMVLPRTGYRTLGPAMFAVTPGNQSNADVFQSFRSAWSTNDSMPIFVTWNGGSNGLENPVWVTDSTGFTWREFWREPDVITRPPVAGFTVSEFFGPDTSNRLIANYLQSGGSDLFIQGILTIT